MQSSLQGSLSGQSSLLNEPQRVGRCHHTLAEDALARRGYCISAAWSLHREEQVFVGCHDALPGDDLVAEQLPLDLPLERRASW